MNEPRGLRALLRDHEARLIHAALQRTGGNQRQAAELLEVPLRTLERKLASLGQRPD
jgi:DNA-binding NtrC family response regulator